MSITLDAIGRLLVTSVYNREIGCILPAILFDPLMKVVCSTFGSDTINHKGALWVLA